ncbi:MAG TPA: hypothetical protein VGC10_07425 [Sphingomonas sp.]
MHIDWWTLALQAINVLILVWLLARFLFRPVMDAIAARQAAADKLLADARAAKDEASAQAAALKAKNDGFATEIEKHRAELRAAADAEHDRLLAQAHGEADALARQAGAAVTAERARMASDLEIRAGALAADIAGKLLQRLPPAPIAEALFDALLDQVRALPEAERAKLARDAPLTIVTPAALDDDLRTRCLRALAAELPGSDTPALLVDPSLIAGFELRGPHMQVRNSWRADLDTILAKLKEDDHARLA